MKKASLVLIADCIISMAICILVAIKNIPLWMLWVLNIHKEWLKSEGYEEEKE